MAAKGQQQRGRSGEFAADKVKRIVLPLPPGDPDREIFMDLVKTENKSGAEILRHAVREYHARRRAPQLGEAS